ncbi:hypothetical protein KUV80_00185 [Fictibacillus nanhaiensis]|uniref:hypothetical protein n=1 Tax=Fictibacillus nanhaiensis TaxID=742169 RepID=UPI001C9759DA|nr:hypothetical protein [Fictibacillus nanhaiensis]MBY6035049.1 hypothetical protein [Fictibacillus nanhaiensis]
MIKWWLGVVCMFFIFIGVVSYIFVQDYASETAMKEISEQLSSNEEEINKLLEDPEIRKYIETGDMPSESLIFTTKKEAVKLISERYTIRELANIREKVSSGLDDEQKEEVYKELQEKFSDEELLALKVVALKEIKKKK